MNKERDKQTKLNTDDQKNIPTIRQLNVHTLCPRSSYPFHIVPYSIKWELLLGQIAFRNLQDSKIKESLQYDKIDYEDKI